MNTSNRRQHWVPQSYLRGFAKGERLRVFARLDGQRGARMFETSVANVANERDLYSATTASGRDTALDDRLRREIEDRLPATLAPLALPRALTDAERLQLVRFAAAQDWRGPSTVENLADCISEVREMTSSLYRQYVPGITDAEIDARFIAQWGATPLSGPHAVDPKNLALAVLDGAFGFRGQFAGMRMCIIESAAHDFVTSDWPVFFHDPQDLTPHPFYGVDRCRPTVEVTFPLTRRHMLFMSRLPIVPYAYANATGVSLINSRIAYGAQRQVYAFPDDAAPRARRQRKDLVRSLGLLSFAMLLLHDAAGRLNQTVGAQLKGQRARLAVLADAFADRRL